MSQLAAQTGHLLVNGAAVGLYLGFTRTADKAKPTALTFKVRPRAHQPRALVAKGGQFHLQHAFAGGPPRSAKISRINPVRSQKFDVPCLFQIALLPRG